MIAGDSDLVGPLVEDSGRRAGTGLSSAKRVGTGLSLGMRAGTELQLRA